MGSKRDELGRGERVLPGVWRLRLPLPWENSPHGNAYAVSPGRRHRPRRHRLRGRGRHSAARVRARAGGLGARATSGWSSAPTPTPTTTASRDRSSTPPAASCGCTRRGITSGRWSRTPRGPWSAGSSSRAAAGCPSPCSRASARLARRLGTGVARIVEPDRDAPRRRRGRDRPRLLARHRDPGPRPLAHRPSPARERPAHLGRPHRREDLPVLRLRAHPGSGGGVPRLARSGGGARHRALPAGPWALVPRRARQGAGLPRGGPEADGPGARRRSATSREPRTR